VSEPLKTTPIPIAAVFPVIDLERCEDYSWLYMRECAHCLGHKSEDEE